MKRKYLLPIIATCMAVAVLAVGFAGWLITGHTATDTATGNFVTYDVSNKYFTVTIKETVDGTPEKIVFGRPEGEPSPTAWLEYEDVAVEDLVANFTVTIRPDVEFDTAAEPKRDVAAVLGTDKVVVTLELPEAYETAQTNKYVGAVTMAATNGTYDGDALTLELPANAFTITADGEDANKTATCAITVEFSWGSKTYSEDQERNLNPYEYYNGLPNNEDNRLAATTLLEAVRDLNEAIYTLSLFVEEGAEEGAGA